MPVSDLIDVWVIYQKSSGGVIRVCLVQPTPHENPNPTKCAILQTKLSQWSIDHAHYLRVQYGKVVCDHAMVGI